MRKTHEPRRRVRNPSKLECKSKGGRGPTSITKKLEIHLN